MLFIVVVRNVCLCTILQFTCLYVLNLCTTSKYSSNYLSAHLQGTPNAAYQRELLVPCVSCWIKGSQMLSEILPLFFLKCRNETWCRRIFHYVYFPVEMNFPVPRTLLAWDRHISVHLWEFPSLLFHTERCVRTHGRTHD
jgi:hypothetical protein